jgi:hypothetical protein
MKRKLTFTVVAVTLIATISPSAFAQGKGGGLNRALGATSKAGGARGLGSNSSNGLARASGNLARGNGGLNKAVPGLSRAGAARNIPVDGSSVPLEAEQSLANQQRILDQRMQQAEHLRGIAERNGNTRLLDTADRMNASATRNFERQTGTAIQPPPTDETAPLPTDGSTTTTTTAPTLQAAPTKSKPSGFWFKSR